MSEENYHDCETSDCDHSSHYEQITCCECGKLIMAYWRYDSYENMTVLCFDCLNKKIMEEKASGA